MLNGTRRYIRNKFETFSQIVYRVKQHTKRSAKRSKTTLSRTSKRIRNSTQLRIRASKAVLISSFLGLSKTRIPDPPCPHLLRSNEAPTDEEAKLILDAIKRAKEEVLQLNSLLLRKQIVGPLERGNGHGWEHVIMHETEEVNHFIQQHQGLLSLFRQLPVEILQEIFLIRVADGTDRNLFVHFGKHPALPISQTCRSWRNVALHLPSLWSCLPPIRIQQSRSGMETQLKVLTELLKRSIRSSLDLCLDTTEFFPKPGSIQYSQPILDLLCQHAERWETFNLVTSHCTFSGMRSIKGRLHALKVLTLSVPFLSSTSVSQIENIDLFEDAPLLTSVEIMAPFSRAVLLPFLQLKHYKESFTLEERQVEKAMSSPVLKTLTIRAQTGGFVFPKFTLSNLVRLYVEFWYGPHLNDEVEQCLGNLTLPAIQDIRLLSRNDNMAPSMLRLLQNSSPCAALKTLALRFRYINPGQLTKMLRLTPSLVHLSCTIPVASTIDIDNIADFTVIDPPYDPLVPKLETCEFFLPDEPNAYAYMPYALNKLAAIRCEPLIVIPAVNNQPFHPLLPEPFVRLKNLTLAFPKYDVSHLQQQFNCLEGWSGYQSTTSSKLNSLTAQLVERLPELLIYHEPGGIRSWGEHDKVAKLLAKIDAVNVTKAIDIYTSGITFLLGKITICQCPGRKNGALASRILEKWKPITEDPDKLRPRRWTLQGDRTLMYIPIDSGTAIVRAMII
ncbi:hypothetical protein JR316_0001784 [Psilocybe cubensis]|uniref:Uncharacterized protein n=2 Tax=Psilocybe cubensis TaxID=181762 RepID=A0ACB8HB47_PSICU|nr:hypothetical protein JR316_0001784 [Psilocybe cubensis]KAH9484882.1 hypothetical protein JR316_0001784 [Psilocybe cubensis]